MGRVFLAQDEVQGGPAAVKILMRDEDPTSGARFIRECSILARVAHPGIVRYLDQGLEPDGIRWLAMEWLDGEDLASLLARRRGQTRSVTVESGAREIPGDSTMAQPLAEASSRSVTLVEVQRVLEIPEVLALLRRVASALAVLHGEGILHRDLKPGNLFLSGGDPALARMIDLGTARSVDARGELTGAGVLIGTPSYMAPEQARAEGLLGTAVDVWALGCIAYECLTGRPPFAGSHVLAIFARILVDEPTPLQLLRPEAPSALASLLARMLAKDPAARPRCQEILDTLDALQAPDAPAESTTARQVIGEAERRVRCVLLARAPGFVGADAALREALERASARVDPLAEGTLLLTLTARSTPGDQALRLVRVALALRETCPGAASALATGQAEDRAQAGVGDLAVRAAAMLAEALPEELRLDEPTAALLEGRFVVEQDARGSLLAGERRTEQARTLLGRPTRTVGRRRELGVLQATWEECVQEPRSRPLLVTAGPGFGKSRLRAEFLRLIERSGAPFTLLLGQGDSLRVGSPFVMVAPALRRHAGILDGDRPDAGQRKLRTLLEPLLGGEERPRVAEFLGEMIGAPVPEAEASDALRAARQDPMLLAEQLSAAVIGWLRSETQRNPVLFLVEDLHWGDRPSIRLLDAALGALQDAPLMVLALARPEVHEVFPSLFSGRGLEEIRLEPLPRRAALELARDVLGEATPLPRLEAIIDRAAGNALYLEELIRAVAEGNDGALPDTVIGMVQARLDALGPDARRLLRAASVFGEVFPEGGVRALAGGGGGGYEVREWLDDLARRELTSALPVSPGNTGSGRLFRFRHALVRDGAYATFTDEDRSLAHRLACRWLEENGERDALTMASHAERGGDDERAIRWLLRAAEQALEGNDLPGVISAGERALARGASGLERGAILALMATAAYWQSRYRDGAAWGLQASGLLPPSGPLWFSAAGSALVSMARLGEFTDFDALFLALRGAHAAPGAAAAQLIALCRGTFQLIFKGRFDDADATLARIAEIAEDAELDALTRAQISHVRGVRSAMVGDVGPFLVNLEQAVDFFERAGDLRNVSLERSTVGRCYVEIGQHDHAIRLLRASLARCQQLRSQQAITYAKANLGYALTCSPEHHDEARSVLAEAVEETRAVSNRRLEGWCRGYLVPVLRAAGDHAAEEREAALACELLASAPGLLAWTLAQRARALLALGRPGQALQVAREAMDLLARLGGLLQGESLPPLALAESLLACGAHGEARDAARDALERLHRRAARLPHPAWRATFLAIEESRLTLDLATRLGVTP
jgi:tetratricopeptide (TPR) repeat protein